MDGESEVSKFQPDFQIENKAPTTEAATFVGMAGLWLSSLNMPNEQLGSALRKLSAQSENLSPDVLLAGKDVFLALMGGNALMGSAIVDEVSPRVGDMDKKSDSGVVIDGNDKSVPWRSKLDMTEYTPKPQPSREFKEFFTQRLPYYDRLTPEQVDYLLGADEESQKQFYNRLYDKIIEDLESRRGNYRAENFQKEIKMTGLYIAVLAAAGEGFSMSDIGRALNASPSKAKYILGSSGRGLTTKLRTAVIKKLYEESVYAESGVGVSVSDGDTLGDVTETVVIAPPQLVMPSSIDLVVAEGEERDKELSPLEKTVKAFGKTIGIEDAEPQVIQGFYDLFAAHKEDVDATPDTKAAGEFIGKVLQGVSLETLIAHPHSRIMIRNLIYGLEYGEGDDKYTTLSKMLSRGEEVVRREQIFTKALDLLVKELSSSVVHQSEAKSEASDLRNLLLDSLVGHAKISLQGEKLTAMIDNVCARLEGSDVEYMPESTQVLRLLRDTLDPIDAQMIRAFLSPSGKDFKPMSFGAIAEMLNKSRAKKAKLTEKEVRALLPRAMANLTKQITDV